MISFKPFAIIIFIVHISLLICDNSIFNIEDFEKGYTPKGEMKFFRYPITDIAGNRIDINSVINIEQSGSYLIFISSPEC